MKVQCYELVYWERASWPVPSVGSEMKESGIAEVCKTVGKPEA